MIILCEDAEVTERNGVSDRAEKLFGKWLWSTFGSLWLSNPGIKQAASARAF